MEEKRKDTYIWPDLAVSSMEAAQQAKKPVYLYGDSGCGKTALVKRYLLTRGSDDDRYVYLQAGELTSRRLEKIAGDRDVTVLVLDDLQELPGMEEADPPDSDPGPSLGNPDQQRTDARMASGSADGD